MKKYLLLASILFVLLGSRIAYSRIVFAQVEKIIWCHCEPNGNCQTLELPQAALEQAGHMDASGNPLHAGDRPGACATPTMTPTPTPTATATPTACPTCPSCPFCPTQSPSPVPTETPTASPSPTEEPRETPSPTPIGEETPSPTPTQGPTSTPAPITPSCASDEHLDLSGTKCLKWELGGPPAPAAVGGGQVLGATNMAKTGLAEESFFNLIFIMGCGLISFGLRKISKISVK